MRDGPHNSRNKVLSGSNRRCRTRSVLTQLTTARHSFCDSPWLEIDLGGSKLVEWVAIYNTARGIHAERLGFHEIWLGDDAGAPLVKCATTTAPSTAGPFMYKCDAVARYVTVRRNVTHTHAATQSRTGTYRAHRRRR